MTLSRTLRNGFVTGFVLLAPLAVTVVVVLFVYNWLVGLIEPFLNLVVPKAGPMIHTASILLLGAAITALGLAVRQGAGQYAVIEFDQLMERIPVVRGIYSSTRQASTALMEHQEQFEHVAFVEWPRTGLQTVGFVTDEAPEHVRNELDGGEPHYNVFVPMSPNPMGGFLAVVPESELTMTELSITEGLQLVVTTGMSGDEELGLEELSDL